MYGSVCIMGLRSNVCLCGFLLHVVALLSISLSLFSPFSHSIHISLFSITISRSVYSPLSLFPLLSLQFSLFPSLAVPYLSISLYLPPTLYLPLTLCLSLPLFSLVSLCLFLSLASPYSLSPYYSLMVYNPCMQYIYLGLQWYVTCIMTIYDSQKCQCGIKQESTTNNAPSLLSKYAYRTLDLEYSADNNDVCMIIWCDFKVQFIPWLI